MVMGRNGHGPKWSWAEMVMGRNDPESVNQIVVISYICDGSDECLYHVAPLRPVNQRLPPSVQNFAEYICLFCIKTKKDRFLSFQGHN